MEMAISRPPMVGVPAFSDGPWALFPDELTDLKFAQPVDDDGAGDQGAVTPR